MELRQTATFREWMRKLKDRKARVIILHRLVRLQADLIGDAHSVGDGVSELRIHFGAGYRIYYTIRGKVVVFLLCGGIKTSQREDIALAKKLAKEI